MSFVQNQALQSLLRQKSENPQYELECRRKIELRTYHLIIDFLSRKKLIHQSSTSVVSIKNEFRKVENSSKVHFEEKKQLQRSFIDGWKWVLSREIVLPTAPMCFQNPPSAQFTSELKRIRVRNSYWDTPDVRIDVTKVIPAHFLSKWEPLYEVEIEVNRINPDSISRTNRALKTIESFLPVENTPHGPISRYMCLLHHSRMKTVVYPKLFVGMMPRTMSAKHEPPKAEKWWISRKCNGERVLIFKDRDACYEIPRHGSMFRANKNLHQLFFSLPNESILDVERLSINDCIVLDVLVYARKNLVATSQDFQERLKFIKSLSPTLKIQAFAPYAHSISHSLPYEWSLEANVGRLQYDGYILTQQSYPFQYGATTECILKSKEIHTVDLLIVKTETPRSLCFLACWSLYAQSFNGSLQLQTQIYVTHQISSEYSDYTVVEFEVHFHTNQGGSLFTYTPVLTRKDKYKPNFIDTVSEIQRSVCEEQSRIWIE